MNRKTRRGLEKKMGKDATNNVAEKISQFGNLPEKCDVCRESFDKKDKVMVQSWRVVARQETVRLFCPNCIQKAEELLNGS